MCVCCSLFVVCCVLFVDVDRCCLLLAVVRCVLLFVFVRCSLLSLLVGWCLSFAGWRRSSFVVGCLLLLACVVRCVLCDVC